MRSHLGEEAGRPFTDAERAALQGDGEHDRSNGYDGKCCILPVPSAAAPLPNFRNCGRDADQTYEYRDQANDLLGYVLRWEARDGERKEFWPVTYWKDETGRASWEPKSWPEPRPLFGLQQLLSRPDAIVLLVEGEKSAQAVEFGPLADAFKSAERPVIGITWPGGSRPEVIKFADFHPLAGRDVVIVPDNDEPGEAAANQLIETLKHVGVRRLRRWKPPQGVPEKWDVADAIPDELTPEGLVESILRAPEIAIPRIVMTLDEFLADFIPPDYLVDGLLQKHFFYSLTGATGSGKTAVGLLLSVLVASRGPDRKLGLHAVEHGRVVYIAAENPTDIQMRMIGMAEKLNLDLDPRNFLVVKQIDSLEKDLPRIKREIASFGEVDLVIADTSPSLFEGKDENDNMQMRDHAKKLRGLCDLPGRPTVLALCHPPKNVTGPDSLVPRGGGAYLAEVDGNFSLWAHGDKLADLHWCGKFRGPDFAKIAFRLTTVMTTTLVDQKGRVLPTVMAEIVSDAEAEANETRAMGQEDKLLVAMLNNPAGSLAEWARACRWFKNGTPDTPDKKRSENVMNRLKRLKLISKKGRDYVLTKDGRQAAKKAGGPSGDKGAV